MTDASKPSSPAPDTGPIKPGHDPVKQWVRTLRFVMAAVAAFILVKASKLFMSGQLSITDAFIAAAFGTLGLSALVEALWPDGDLGWIHLWTLTAVGAAGVAAWACGGPKWIGFVGSLLFLVSFFVSAAIAARTSKGP